MFFGRESFGCRGVGVSGSGGSCGVGVSCLPAQLCRRLEGARGCRELGVGRNITSAKTSPPPEAAPGVQGLRAQLQPAKKAFYEGGSSKDPLVDAACA